MPVRRALGSTALGGGLGSLADYIQQMAMMYAQRDMIDKTQAKTQAALDRRQAGTELNQLIEKIGAKPEDAETLLTGARANPFLNGEVTGSAINFDQLRPSQETLLKPLLESINNAKSPLDIPSDIPAAAAARGVRTPLTQDSETGAPQPGIPAQFSAALPPQIQQLIDLAEQRKQAQQAEVQAKIQDEVAKAQALGPVQAQNAGATMEAQLRAAQKPDIVQGDIDKKTQEATALGPINASNAGLTAAAQARGVLAPDIIKGKAAEAGSIEAARLAAQKAAGISAFGDATNQLSDVTRTGKQYLNLQKIPGQKEQAAALQSALTQGIPVVNKSQAAALEHIDTARGNQDSMLRAIFAKLPKTPEGRIAGQALANRMAAYFQTDADLTAFNAFREAAINQIKAVAGSGGVPRITQQQIELAVENDIPKITDTGAVAVQKVRNVSKMLDNIENSILVRDRSTLVGK